MKVLVTFYSRSGNTEKMASEIAKGAREAGAEVDVRRAAETSTDDLLAADAVAVGSPDYFSYVAGQVKTLFDEALSLKGDLSGKPGACFSSHGGGGKVTAPFEHLMEAVGFQVVAPCALSHNEPAGKTIDELRELGARLARAAG